MTREEMIDEMIKVDIDFILSSGNFEDVSFLDAVLRGEGWKPYNQLTDEEILTEYEEMINGSN